MQTSTISEGKIYGVASEMVAASEGRLGAEDVLYFLIEDELGADNYGLTVF